MKHHPRQFSMLAFDGLHSLKGDADTDATPGMYREGTLAAGSVVLLTVGTHYTPLAGAPGETEGDFRRRRTAQLSDPANVTGIPEAVAFRQDVVVVMTDPDDAVPQGARVIIPEGTLASVVEAAAGSTGVVAPGVPTGDGEPVEPPANAWWTRIKGSPAWLKWAAAAAGAGLVVYVGWKMAKGK